MKKIFTLLCATAMALGAYAQTPAAIPNGSFENWGTVGGHPQPNSWTTLNSLATTPAQEVAKQKTTGAADGSSYIELTSKSALGTVLPGVAILGTLVNPLTYNIKGVPYTNRPVSLKGFVKYASTDTFDSPELHVYFTKWNTTSSKRDTIGGRYVFFQPDTSIANWAAFTINMAWAPSVSANPDSVIIILSSNFLDPAVTPIANQISAWDGLAFSNIGAGIEVIPGRKSNSLATAFGVYPNPVANGNVTVGFEKPAVAGTLVSLMDMNGRVLSQSKVAAGSFNHSLNTQGLAAGTYLVRVEANGQTTTSKKLIVK